LQTRVQEVRSILISLWSSQLGAFPKYEKRFYFVLRGL
jgi:hypothetical protein